MNIVIGTSIGLAAMSYELVSDARLDYEIIADIIARHCKQSEAM